MRKSRITSWYSNAAFLFLIFAILAPPLQAAEISCIVCHEGQPGRLGDPVEQWRGSIHAKNGIFCNACHGGDPSELSMEAMSPQRGFLGVPEEEQIPDVCGGCHIGVREDYLQSAHGLALGSGGPQCVTCHGNHAVQLAGPELINEQRCSRCHEYGRAEEIKTAVVETDRVISGIEQKLASLKRLSFATAESEGEVFAQRNRFHRIFHSVDVEKVRGETTSVRQELEKVQDTIKDIEKRLARRHIFGGVLTGLLVLTGIIAFLVRRTYRDEEKS